MTYGIQSQKTHRPADITCALKLLVNRKIKAKIMWCALGLCACRKCLGPKQFRHRSCSVSKYWLNWEKYRTVQHKNCHITLGTPSSYLELDFNDACYMQWKERTTQLIAKMLTRNMLQRYYAAWISGEDKQIFPPPSSNTHYFL